MIETMMITAEELKVNDSIAIKGGKWWTVTRIEPLFNSNILMVSIQGIDQARQIRKNRPLKIAKR